MAEPDIDAPRVWKLMRDIEVCMLASRDGEVIRARPLKAFPREDEAAVYFLTLARGHKDEEIESDSSVCLSFANPKNGKYLAVVGDARLSNDREKIASLWEASDTIWAKSAEDPDLRLITVTPHEAQFWEGPHGIVGTVAMIAAAATGGMPLIGENRKVQLG